VSQNKRSRLAKEGLLDQLIRVKFSKCKSCLAGKITIKPFDKAMRASSPL